MREYNTLVGTPAFASLNSHLKRELSRRDDLEALAYSLMFLYRGTLPWLEQRGQDQSSSFIQKMKESITDTRSIPSELFSLLCYARNLAFVEKPNYDHIRMLLLPTSTTIPQTITHTESDGHEGRGSPRRSPRGSPTMYVLV